MLVEAIVAEDSAVETREKAKLLSRVNLLESLSREEVEKIALRTAVVRFERGRKVYTPAYQGGGLFFLLLQGRVRVYKRMEGVRGDHPCFGGSWQDVWRRGGVRVPTTL